MKAEIGIKGLEILEVGEAEPTRVSKIIRFKYKGNEYQAMLEITYDTRSGWEQHREIVSTICLDNLAFTWDLPEEVFEKLEEV